MDISTRRRTALALSLAVLLSGCAVTRVTTTKRTAVEQALLSESARSAIRSISLDEIKHKRVFVAPFAGLEAASVAVTLPANQLPETTANPIEPGYLSSALIEKLAEDGASIVQTADEADVLIFPRLDYHGIDDAKSLLGVPSVPIPVPGAETLQTPEIALLGKYGQYARSKISLYSIDKQSGKFLERSTSKPRERYYSRWTALIFFEWRSTDLEDPF
ncbi:MAG: hypothetical protein KDD44_05790 [Bdellovibrionales bacterium]|nr:hypothetical protein [Bdellovibrionales bacterium]